MAVFPAILESFKHFAHSFEINAKRKGGCFSGEHFTGRGGGLFSEFYRTDKITLNDKWIVDMDKV